MKNHIKQVRIKPRTQQWLDWRYEHGFGGSDIASVVATKSSSLAQLVYSSPIKFFLEKCGEPITLFSGNIQSESGIFFEPIIIDWFRYYDLDAPDQMQMFQNIKDKRKINKCVSPKVFVVNSKYPNLFYSPDSFCWKNFGKEKTLIETKNTSSMETARFVNKISPAYYLQAQMGLMITELPRAYLVLLIDGRWLETTTIEPDQKIWDLILESSTEFWERIQKAREIKKRYSLPSYFGVNPETLTEEQRAAAEMLSQLEPDITGTDSELDFIKERIIPKEGDVEMPGTEIQRQLCEEYLTFGHQQDDLEIERKKRYIELIRSLEGTNKAVFEDKTFFSYKSTATGSRKLYVSPKILKA